MSSEELQNVPDFLSRSGIEIENVNADYIIETMKSFKKDIDEKLFDVDNIYPCSWNSFPGQYKQCIAFLAEHFVNVFLRYVVEKVLTLDTDDYNVLIEYLDDIYPKEHKADKPKRDIAENIASFFLDYYISKS